jgi:cytochrome P450
MRLLFDDTRPKRLVANEQGPAVSTGGTPLRAGVLHIEELPMAEDRSLACQMIRQAGAVVRDAHGAFQVTGASAADYVLRHPELFSSARAFGTVDFCRRARNLAFGAGPHGCLGAQLARMEMRVALEEWHRKIPDYQIAPGASVSAGWPAAVVGFDHLPLVFPRGDAGMQNPGRLGSEQP